MMSVHRCWTSVVRSSVPRPTLVSAAAADVGARTFSWTEFVRTVRAKGGGTRTEDPLRAYVRMDRADNAEGLDKRAKKYEFYEKPWMKRKRVQRERTYRAAKVKVEDLRRWIVFRQQNDLPVDGKRVTSKKTNDLDDLYDL